jgi:hypothetical protein
MSAAPQPIEPSPMAADGDQLAAVRRADWRFLLPDPSLGRVAYLAPHEPALVDALRAAGATVDTLAGPAPLAAYDVAVLTGGRPDRVAASAALLRPGGWLCAEVTGRATRRWTRALRAQGFQDVAAHWLWPHAGACREIVPLERAALGHALGRRDPGGRLRLRVRAAQLLVHAGLFSLAARSALVIGRLP